MTADVSIVAVTFGDVDAATRVGTGLEAVQRSAGDPPMEVVVVAVGAAGRAAADELVAKTAGTSLEPLVVEVEDGTAFARAANAGVAKAAGDVLVVARPEVTFHQRFLARVRGEADEAWDLLAPAVREGEDKESTGVSKRGRSHRMAPVRPPSAPGSVPAGHGACVVMRRSALERRLADVGGVFEEELGSGGEALDLFWWAEQRGLTVRYVPTMYVGFAVGQAIRLGPADHRREMANYRTTVWKHARRPREWVGWALGEASYAGEAVAAGRLRGLLRYLGSWADSVRAAVAIKRRRGRLRVR